MPTISLCMIVKNEEMNIARCLDSMAGLVEEIIVVDTGSADRTVEIVSNYTSKVYSYPWNDDFSDARNYSLSKASMDYCMWMDADDILKEDQKDKFLELKESLSPGKHHRDGLRLDRCHLLKSHFCHGAQQRTM